MKKPTRPIALAMGSLVITALGGTGVALSMSPAQAASSPGESHTSHSDGDQASQDAACKAAGVDPSASNVQYDDATGVCSVDKGGDSSGEN